MKSQLRWKSTKFQKGFSKYLKLIFNFWKDSKCKKNSCVTWSLTDYLLYNFFWQMKTDFKSSFANTAIWLWFWHFWSYVPTKETWPLKKASWKIQCCQIFHSRFISNSCLLKCSTKRMTSNATILMQSACNVWKAMNEWIAEFMYYKYLMQCSKSTLNQNSWTFIHESTKDHTYVLLLGSNVDACLKSAP